MTVYMCEPWLEGILCGVYDAWSEPAGHGNVRLAVKGEYEELELLRSTGRYRAARRKRRRSSVLCALNSLRRYTGRCTPPP